ncbi:phage tail tape measure protein [Deinococcus sp. Leaf326]|uniref:phage tail tape measure protein n=1 Tax=Deinococcus sp. Leaf326 TaxID=1736338 RepID=UPI0006F2B1BF|nr:phage tail tape measure protein [Deinococcus sp. Leaf326]KQR40742.1 hypothetical protein ASF71_00815 [Deinococcus sp. Leaf326]
MTQVGKAIFDVEANAGRATRTLRDVAREAQRILGGISLTPKVDRAGVAAELRKAVQDVKAQLRVGISPVSQADVDKALGKVASNREVTLDLKGDMKAKLDEIKQQLADLRSTSASVLTIDTSAVKAVITLLNKQIADLNALENKLRSLRNGAGGSGGNGGGSGGGSPGPSGNTALTQIARDLQIAQSQYDRGATSLKVYLRELERIRTAGQSMAGGLAAGSKEAQALERVMKGLATGTAGINSQSIVKLRSDLAGARAEFERATGAAGRFNFVGQQQATRAYEAALKGLETRIRAVGERGTTTAGQLRSLNQLSAQLGSQRNAINGTFTQVGISNNILNALKTLPQFAAQAGGSLGAAAAQAQVLTSNLSGVAAAAGPVGVAVGVMVTALLAGAVAFADLGRVGLQELGKLQQGMNVLQANGETDFAGVTQGVRDLQTELGAVGGAFTRGDLTAASADIVKAGVSVSDSLKLMGSSARLASVDQVNLTDASGQLLKNLRQYGLGVEDAGKVSDMLAKAGNLAAGTTNDLSIGLGIVGTTGKQAKIEMYDLLGMLVQLDNVGMSAADVGANGLRAALAALSDVTPKGERALASLGIKIRDEFGHMKPAGDLVKELSTSLRGMGVEVNRATGQLEGNGDALNIVSSAMDTRAAAAVLALGNGWKAYGQQVKDSTEFTKQAADIMQQGVAPAMKSLNNAWRDAGAELVTSFAVPLADLLNNHLTPAIKGLGDFFREVREGGPVLQEIRGYVIALAVAIGTLQAVSLGQGLVSLLGGAVGLRSILPTLIGGFRGLGPAAVAAFGTARVAATAFWTSLTTAGGVSAAFGVIKTAVMGLIPALRGVTIAAGGALGGLTVAVTAAAGLAIAVNKIMADTAKAYDQADKGNQQSFDTLMARVRALNAEGTELSRAKAKYLLLVQQISDAQEGEFKGVSAFGERLYGPPDEARIKKLQGDLATVRGNIQQLTAEDGRRAEAAKLNSGKVSTAIKLTDDQLKAQTKTIREMRAELAKPLKLFGGTEFQGQLDQVAEKYRLLREKLRENVLDPKQRNDLSRQLTARQGQERGQVRNEFQSRAADAAGQAERQVQQARVNAMAEGSARIRAQALLDIAEVRRTALESAKAWRDFPAEKARILAAGEAQVAGIQAQANRQALESDKKAADARAREIAAQARKARAALRARQAEERAAIRQEQTVQSLGRRLGNLNEDFGLNLSQGKVAAGGLQNFQQALEGLNAEIGKLPEGERGRFAGLVAQATELGKRGDAAVKLGEQIAEVRGRVNQMTAAELEAARARYIGVAAAQALVKAIDTRLPTQRAAEYRKGVEGLKGALSEMTAAELANRLATERSTDTQGRRIKLLTDEIEARRKLRDATLEQGRLELQKGDADAVVSNYDTRRTQAQARGDTQELLSIEQEMGAEVLAARQRLAQVAAAQEILQVREKYRGLIAEAQKHGQDTAALEAQRDDLIEQARDRRNDLQVANAIASDQQLLTQTREVTAELIRLANERQDGIDAVSRGQGEGVVGRAQLATDLAGEDLSARLRAEQQWEVQVRDSRQNLATLTAQADIRAQTEKYRVLGEKATGNDDEQRRLQLELNAWIISRNEALGTEIERIGFETAQSRLKAERALADALLALDRDLIDGLNQRAQSEASRKQGQFDADLQGQLRAVGDNEAAKLTILRAAETTRIALSNQSVNARMLGEQDAENRRFEDLRRQAITDGTWASRREVLEREHQARLTEIGRQGAYDKAQAVTQIQREVEDQNARTQEKSAQNAAKGITKGLSDMTLAQRQGARTALQGWLTTFQAMGVAGQAAARAIQEALDQVAEADASARQRAVDLADKLFPKDENGRYQNPEVVTRSLADRTGKIGKADTIADAESKGREAYATEITNLQQGIADAQAVLDELGKLPVDQLDARQALALRMAQQYLPIFRSQLTATQQAASDAGKAAGKAFVDGLSVDLVKAQDAAADAGLQLAEANLKLARSRGLPGTTEYNAALRAYRDYWEGRVTVLQGGLAAAQAAESTARTTLKGASTPEARAAAQTTLTAAITATSVAQSALNTATTNYVSGQQQVIESTKTSTEGVDALAEARRALAGVLGTSTFSYESELKSLKDLIEKYPEQAEALGRVRAEYERIQALRQGIANVDSLKLDFQIGFNSGKENLQKSVSNLAQGFGQITSPLQLFSAILDKINPAGMILEGMFSVLEEPIKALQEPFKIIGTLLGSVLAPLLELLAPVLQAVASLFVILYDAIAAFIKAITFGLVNIDRRDPNDSAEGRRELAGRKGDNDSAELDGQYREGLIDRKSYEEGKLALVKARIERERAAELEKAEGNAALTLEINRRFDAQWLKDRQATLDEIAAYDREIEGMNGENELSELERRRRQGLISEREYQGEKYRLKVESLNRERATELAAAEGDQRKILAINRKYDGQVLDAKLDMLEALSEAYRNIGQTLMQTITGSVKDGLMSALKAGNFGQFRTSFRKNLREAMFEAVVSAAIESAAIQGLLKPAIDALVAAFQTDDTSDDNAAIQGLLKAGAQAETVAGRIYRATKPLRDAWGITGDSGQSQSMEVTGTIDTPEVRISLDALGMLAGVIQNVIPSYQIAIAGHTPVLAAHTAALPTFSTAVDAFGLHTQAYLTSTGLFGGHVAAFGGHVTAFGGHVRYLADAVRSGGGSGSSGSGGYTPTTKR